MITTTQSVGGGRTLKPTASAVPRSSAGELWLAAQKARNAAKHYCSFASMSVNGAAFSQLQSNAACAAAWEKVERLEEAALHAWMLEKAAAATDGASTSSS